MTLSSQPRGQAGPGGDTTDGRRRIGGIVYCLIAGATVVAYYFFHFRALNAIPIAGGDETSFLDIPYRWLFAGDWRYPLIHSDTFNAGSVRAYPPLLAFAPRTLFHQVVGFSAGLSRWYSAALVFGTVAMIVGLALRIARSAKLALAIAALCAVSPTFFLLSRSVRFEQETAFFGVASFALPLLVLGGPLPAQVPRRVFALALWWFAAVCCSLAAGSHPLALGFAVPVAVSSLCGHRYWSARDGLTFRARLAALVAGALPLVLLSTVPLIFVHGGYLNYIHVMSDFNAQRNATFEAIYAGSTLHPLGWFGTAIAAHVMELADTTFTNRFLFRAFYDLPIRIAPFCIVITALIAGIYRWRSGFARDDFPFLIGLAALIGLLVTKCLYSVNTTYGIYPAVGCLCTVALPPRLTGLAERRLADFQFALVVVCAAIAFLVSIPHLKAVVRADAAKAMTLDDYNALLRQDGRAAYGQAFAGEAKPRIYTDTVAWMAAFPNEATYLEILTGVQNGPIDGVVADVDALNFFLNYWPLDKAPANAPAIKAERFLEALKPLRLVGVSYFADYGKEALLYRRKTAQDVAAPRIRYVTRDRDVVLPIESTVAFTNAGDLWTPNTKLDEGCYVVTIRPSAADAGMPRVHVASSDGTLRQDSMPFFGVALATAADRVVTLRVNQGDEIRDIGGTAIASIDAYKIADHPEICRSR